MAMTFVKFQNPDEVETIGMWKVWSDKPFEGLSRAAIELEDCASSAAVGPEEDLGPQESIRGINPNDPLMTEFEDSALTPPVFLPRRPAHSARPRTEHKNTIKTYA